MGYNKEHKEHDFITRTRKVVGRYGNKADEKYEVTLLLNCFIGLLIVPQQKWYSNLMKNYSADPISKKDWGIDPDNIIFVKDEYDCNNKSLFNIARHLRNSVSHNNFDAFADESNSIETIKFLDYTNSKRTTLTFEATILIEDLYNFLNIFSNKILRMIEKEHPSLKSKR